MVGCSSDASPSALPQVASAIGVGGRALHSPVARGSAVVRDRFSIVRGWHERRGFVSQSSSRPSVTKAIEVYG